MDTAPTLHRGILALILAFFALDQAMASTPNKEPLPTMAERNKYALRSGPLEVPYVPRRGYADGPYGQVHFRDTGGDGIPIILCHMCPQTSKQFTAVYELFQKRGIRAIGVDTPGFGESDPTPFVPAVQDWAPAFVAVLDHLGISKAHFLGHHTGSKTATEVALQFPERVGKLVLQGPTPYTEERRLQNLQGLQDRAIDLVYKTDGSHLQGMFHYRTQRWNCELGDGSADPKLFTRYCSEMFQGYARRTCTTMPKLSRKFNTPPCFSPIPVTLPYMKQSKRHTHCVLTLPSRNFKGVLVTWLTRCRRNG